MGNSDMLARWQKEKKMRDQTISELDDSQSELRRVQQQLLKAQRELEKIGKQLVEKEEEKQVLQTRKRPVEVKKRTSLIKPTMFSPKPSKDATEVRAKILEMLQEYDHDKVDKLDVIMERFKGRESLLLDKMINRYENDRMSVTSSSSRRSRQSVSTNQRSELAMAKHMERMTKRKEKDP